MLTLDSALHIPAHVLFTTVAEEVVLLNTRTNDYFALEEVGARFWSLLTTPKTLREAHQSLLEEFEVEPLQLEKDLLELIQQLREHGLVEVTEA